MELTNLKINFLGDSITEGVGASAPEFVFHQVLKRSCDLKEARNYGISGSRIARQIHPSADTRMEQDFCLRASQMDPDADVIVVFGGTNDSGHGDAPFGTFSDRTPYTFYGACHCMMETLINCYPGKPIVIMTPLHRENEDSYASEIPKNKTLQDYVNAIREVAEYYALPVLDLYATSGIQPRVPVLKEMFCPDGLHPSDAGNAKIAHMLEQFLKNL